VPVRQWVLSLPIPLRPLQAAAITYRIAVGPRAGQKVLPLRGAMPREVTARQPLHELQRTHHKMRRAVSPRSLQLELHLPCRVDLDALVRQRGPGDVAAQPGRGCTRPPCGRAARAAV